MITFLPEDSFCKCASALDDKRLLKQIVEAFQLLNALSKIDSQGRQIGTKLVMGGHHPACLMWIGYENALRYYIACMMCEFKKRGGNYQAQKIPAYSLPIEYPQWNNETMWSSHRSMLYAKNPDFYEQYKKDCGQQYYWPWTWNPARNQRVQITPEQFHKIARLPKSEFHKAMAVIKKS
jgi:hypothetical protein